MSDKLTRIAIVNNDRCKPKKCRQECKKSCPVVRMGKLTHKLTHLLFPSIYFIILNMHASYILSFCV